MKNIILLLFILFSTAALAQNNNSTVLPKSLDSLSNQVKKLMDFYDSYDDGSPESLKKAKYNDAVDEISGGTATQSDKDAAYKLINAYIKGDKELENNKPQQNTNGQSFNDAIENSQEVQEALKFVEQQKTILTQMSYSEFENYILKANPAANKKEIKTAFNEIHQNDGKQVAITPADEKMSETEKQLWAMDVLQNPKNYEELRKACKILNPNMSDTEIRKAWDKK